MMCKPAEIRPITYTQSYFPITPDNLPTTPDNAPTTPLSPTGIIRGRLAPGYPVGGRSPPPTPGGRLMTIPSGIRRG